MNEHIFSLLINEANIVLYMFNLLVQESEPISSYLNSEIPLEVKQRIARMGADTMLKMVRYINVSLNVCVCTFLWVFCVKERICDYVYI